MSGHARVASEQGAVLDGMQRYLEHELPALERAARERIEASVELHISLPLESLLEEGLQQGRHGRNRLLRDESGGER